MPKVRLRYGSAGPGRPPARAGDVVEVDAKTAKFLIETNQADAVQEIETASVEPAESAALMVGKKRGRRPRAEEE